MNNSKADISAFDAGAYYITYKDRTRYEVINKLNEKGYSSQDIEYAISKLSEYGYIDDEKYALFYIRSNINNKGINRIVLELTRRGVGKEDINKAIDIMEFNECDTVEDIFNRRYIGYDLSDDRTLRRIFSFFLRRGFKYENINRVVNEYKKLY